MRRQISTEKKPSETYPHFNSGVEANPTLPRRNPEIPSKKDRIPLILIEKIGHYSEMRT